MGSPPPPDAPDIPTQDATALDFNFQVTPPIALLCGYKVPAFKLNLSVKLPFQFPPAFPPEFFFAIGIRCDLENPIDVSAGIAPGGGRKSTFDPDPDDNAKF
jgi:hypothetical protein